jgi:TPR repeat protein
LLRRGEAFLATGDIAAARLVLQRAAEAGDARAALTLAETYDPIMLEKLGIQGLASDIAVARTWYERAKEFGSAEAMQRLGILASRAR